MKCVFDLGTLNVWSQWCNRPDMNGGYRTMSAIQYEAFKELDNDWIQLMTQAKELGYTTDEVRGILAVMQEGMLEEANERFA